MPYVGKKPADIIATAIDTTTGTFSGVVDADAGITVDNITIDGTEIDLSSGDLTIDSAGDIILDADGADIKLKDGGTQFGQLYKNGNDFRVESNVSDGDLVFTGNDGGSGVTALTLDMSDAGTATFNHDVRLGTDGAILNIGNDNDLKITHNGTDGDFESAGTLTFDVASNIILDADGGDIFLKDGGTSIGQIALNNSGFFDIYSAVQDADVRIRGNDGGSTVTALTLDMSDGGAATLNNGLTLTDGNLVVASGHGIDFSAASNATNMTSELLDDYEEGTWTPTDDSDSGGSVTAFGRYTKVGRLVTIHFTVRIDSNFTQHNRIGGLPFAPVQDVTLTSVNGMFVMRSNNRDLYGHLISGATYFQLVSDLVATTATPATSDGTLRGNCTYQAS